MDEEIVDEDAGLGSIADHHAVDVLEMDGAYVGSTGLPHPAELARPCRAGRRAFARAGMRVVEGRGARGADQQALSLVEAAQEGREAHRVVARGRAESLAEGIGLALHVATVGRLGRRSGAGQREWALVPRDGLLLGRVAIRGVDDLVA